MAGVLCIVSVIAYFELTKATGVHTEGKKINGMEIAGAALIALYYAGLYTVIMMCKNNIISAHAIPYVTLIFAVPLFNIIMSLIVFMFVYVFSFPKYKAGEVMAAYFELIYAPVLLSFLFFIRETFSDGLYLVWLVYLCSWGSDTCAYCVGVLFGRHKMAPKLSPRKSIEGAVGGVVGAALLVGLYIILVIRPFAPSSNHLNLGSAMCLGAIGALVSMVGDLAASAIKRDHDIKDYGKLIPGHGGIMDRFDSVIIVAPLIFIGLMLIGAR